MQESRVLLREAEEALIQLNLVKARIVEEYAKKANLAQGANKGAKKGKVLARLAIEEQNAVSNMELFYREKLFSESNNKKKAAEKDRSDKEKSIKTRPSFLLQKELG